MNLLSKRFAVLSFFLALSLLAISQFNPTKDLAKNDKILPPPEGLEYFHLGFADVASDLLWLGFIQHSFDCSKYKDEKGERCPYRWGYKTLNEASKLSPKSQALYKHGAVKLSVLLEDHQGASEIFERGLGRYPKDWLVNYRAAYLYMEELKEPERAAQLLEVAAANGAPYWTRSLASRLYNESGQLELSYRILLGLYKESKPGKWRESLEKRLALLQEKIKQSQP